MQKNITPAVSVIVASHRKELIKGFTSSLFHSLPEQYSCEIIIIADYPIDQYKLFFPEVNWIYVNNKSISAKRNIGIKAAKADICAFTDDDCIPSDSWINTAFEYLKKHPDIIGVEGLTAISPYKGKNGAFREFKRLETPGFRTNNIFYRREVLLKHNMFDERFTFQREDVDLAYSLIESGNTIGFCPDIMVTHRFRDNDKWDLLKNCFNRRFDPLLHYKHKKLYRKYIKTPFPLGIIMVLLLHLILLFWIIIVKKASLAAIICNFSVILFLTVRRSGLPSFSDLTLWIREFLSYTVSPFVLAGSLLYGSIRFRHLLFF